VTPEPARGGEPVVVSAAVGRRGAPQPGMSIGEVLAELRPEFPDVTISKIRFLEEQGLVDPDRTPAGYRKFTHADVERLRYVLSVQRDHYLPLRVIRDHLDSLDRGFDPPPLPGRPPRLPRLVPDASVGGVATVAVPGGEVRMSRDDLLEATGASAELLDSLESFGLVSPRTAAGQYDVEAVTVTRAAAQLAGFGIEPRHLRAFRAAAEREAGLAEQVVAPMRRQRGPEASARADELASEVAGLCLQLHAALVRTALDRGER
jgi:DNA-binding transcriptional MerR regulator